MADIAMDYSAVGELVKDINSMHDEFEQLLEDLDSMISSLDGQWKGNAHTKFVNSYKKIKPDMLKIKDALEKSSEGINKVISNQMEADSATAVRCDSLTMISF